MLTNIEMTDTEGTVVRERLAALIEDLEQAALSGPDAWGATFDAGLSRVSWPVGAGGLDVRPELQSIVDAELARIGIPDNYAAHAGGIGVAAPVVAKFGTDDQKAKYLRKLFTCEEYWC